MKKKLVALSLVVLAACSNTPGKDDGKPAAIATPPVQTAPVQNSAPSAPAVKGSVFATYSPAQSMALIQQKQDLMIIDVRSPQELRQGRIENSTLISFWDIMKGNYSIPQGRPLLVVCAVGGRSYAAMQILAQKGYTEIYNLGGGIDAWKKAGLPLVY